MIWLGKPKERSSLCRKILAVCGAASKFEPHKTKKAPTEKIVSALVENAYVHLPIRSSRLMGSVRLEKIPQSPSAKNVPPAHFLNAVRLKHGRPASHLKVLPRAPCFGSSSNSLHPPPAAVVLVTFEPGILLLAY